jgi:hypothetical protein
MDQSLRPSTELLAIHSIAIHVFVRYVARWKDIELIFR